MACMALPRPLERLGRCEATVERPHMKALVLNAVGRGFDFEDVDIATARRARSSY